MQTTQVEPTTRPAQNLIRESCDSRVVIADGYDIRMTVRSGQLQIIDGIRTGRRTRIISRADGISRIIVLSETGLITLEAMRWAELEGIAIAQYQRDGHLVISSCAQTHSPRILQSQVIAAMGGMPHLRLESARSWLTVKLEGQAAIMRETLNRDDCADRIIECLRHLDKASSVSEMLGYEGDAARTYWKAWTKAVVIPWSSIANLPAHWLTYFPRRRSGTRVHPSQRRITAIDRTETGNRGATDPINAMLNYAYRIAETEAKISCLIHGINPDIGFMHMMGTDRNAMALDLLEVARPLCDQIILGIVASDPFDSRWCYESRYGIVRLAPPLTHMITERSLDMARVMEPYASALASVLSSAQPCLI